MPEAPWIFPYRADDPEILDDFDLPENDLARNLRELESVNRYLGGHSILETGMARIVKRREGTQYLHLVDVGCGGGDSLRFMASLARKHKWPVRFTGIDANKKAVELAREKNRSYPEVKVEQMDVFSPGFRQLQADIFTFNLVLHHFDDQLIKELLSTCHQQGDILINDLQRNRLAFFSFALFSRLMRFSFISRHDGLLSIRKSFSRSELYKLLANTGINGGVISWHWAFRYLVLIPMRNSD